MNGKKILAVAGDRGGWNALELPLLRALDAGCAVHVYFVGTCAQQLANGQLVPDKRMKVTAGSAEMKNMDTFFSSAGHHLTVIGASQSEEGTKAAWHAMVLSHSVPRLGLQDMYGSSMPMLRLMDNALERLCVTDEFSRAMVLQEFRNLADNIVVTGGPQFDRVLEMKKTWDERRQKIRQEVGAKDDDLVFLVAGQPSGTAEVLTLLEAGITFANVERRAYVVLRQHARATEEDRQAVRTYASSPLQRGWFRYVDHAVAPTKEDILPGADFVLSGYSTTNYYGILLGMPGVVYCGTPLLLQDLKREKGLDRPPEVQAGAAWYATTPQDMEVIILAVTRAGIEPGMQRAQQRIQSFNDGHATDRVWAEMQNLMS